MNRSAIWFGRVMWIGIIANILLSVPGILAPERLFALFSMPLAAPLMWPRFASLLLLLLSLFYIPAAVDLNKYRANAWLAQASRLAGFLFFLTQSREYLPFGLYDLAFLIPQSILLFFALRSKP